MKTKTKHIKICEMKLKESFKKKMYNLYAYIRKEEKSKISCLSVHLKKIQKE